MPADASNLRTGLHHSIENLSDEDLIAIKEKLIAEQRKGIYTAADIHLFYERTARYKTGELSGLSGHEALQKLRNRV